MQFLYKGFLTLLVFCFSAIGSLTVANTMWEDKKPLTVWDLKVEYFTNPIGIDDQEPRLSWKLSSSTRNVMQKAYQIQVAKSQDFSSLLWDSRRNNSDQSVHVHYKGPKLESGNRYYWRVRVWDNRGNQSRWSQPAYWEMGLLSSEDWQAKWIEPDLQQDTTKPQPSPMIRHEFELDKKVKSARVYATSRGLYEMKINGKKVGDQVFTPGWTSYNKRLQYQTYDVTGYLDEGKNAVGVLLGDGWYRGWIGFNDQRNYYGSRLGLLAQLEVTYTDGSKKIIATDGSWKASTGAILKSDIYEGETYDARLEKDNWATSQFNDEKWAKVIEADHTMGNLVAPEGPPVRKIQEFKPLDVFTTPEGDTVLDMGQNMVGWIRMKVKGPEGTKVTLEHAEVLDKEGNFYTANLRAADQKDEYILKGKKSEIYEPTFTFHGFRYVRVEGYPGKVSKDNFTAVVIHSDMEPTGHFETSNALVNQLQHNIVWGQKSNFLDVPTDCPQRDERLGWTGDIQVFAQTASYNMQVAGFLSKWLQDLEADQSDDGSVSHVVPNVLGKDWSGASGWGDASVIVPWTIYQAYGDVDILERQYGSMKAWVEYMRKRAQKDSTTYQWDNNFTFGDWLSFNSTASDYPGAYTDKDLISTAYFARSADLLGRIAKILGKQKEAEEYSTLKENIKQAFQREYLTSNGRVMSNTQTAYLLALQFDLLPADKVNEAVHHLVSRIDERGHLTTGFLGTPHLNPVLTQFGHNPKAYELLLRKEYPSWLYPVTRGATTIWERWDGIKPDSTFQDKGMNSLNHYAYGAIGEWLYKTVAGIEPASPGYKEIEIRPNPGDSLTHARSIKRSMYGDIVSDWEYKENRFRLSVTIPVNTTATVVLPDAAGKQITANGRNIQDAMLIKVVSKSGDAVEIEVGSGDYHFSYVTKRKYSSENNTNLTIDAPLGELIANSRTRDILRKHLPVFMNSPWLSQVMGYPLERAVDVLPIQHQITKRKIRAITNDVRSVRNRD